MTIWSNPNDRSWQDNDDVPELNRFEKIRPRRDGIWGVGADTPCLRARQRSRGGPAARRKARLFNSIAHRSRYRHLVPGP